MRSIQTRCISVATIVATLAWSCGGHPPAPTGPVHTAVSSSDLVFQQLTKLPRGLAMEVREGKTGAPAYDHAQLAPATRLPDADAAALLARAPAIATDPADQQAFALRERSQPPPRTGVTVASSFPPPASSLLPPATSNAGGDLHVIRMQPEGKVPLAPELSVTFDQPMVAVTGQDDAAATTPVRLDPQPPGRWRWIGTRTILFDPDVRFPQATTYHVAVPAGTKSATGGVLVDAVAFTFETPPPKLTEWYPTDNLPQRLDVPMYALFDQKIDPAAVLAQVRVTANGKPVAVRLLSADELAGKAADPHLAATIASARTRELDGRWLAFRATEAFPKDAAIDISFGAGTPSAEGKLTTTASQDVHFRTYPPLQVVRATCGWNNQCPPGAPFQIQLNNPLDVAAWDDRQLTISPELPDAKIVEASTFLTVTGPTVGRTTYTVTLASAIRDEFGQTLGSATPLTFAVGDAEPAMFGPQGLVVLDPQATRPTFDVFTTNVPKLVVKLYQVDLSMVDAFGHYLENRWNHDHPPAMPGKKVVDTLLAVAASPNRLVETAIDLRPVLDRAGLGHAIAVVEPSPWPHDYPAPQLIAWVESTRLGVDAHVDGDHMDVLATELATGKPAAGVALEIRPFGVTGKTDDRGDAALALATTQPHGVRYVVARRGDDVAFVSDGSFADENGAWMKQGHAPVLAWYVTDDRALYKPGEQVSLKGWLRAIDHGKGGDVGGIAGAVSAVDYKAYDSRGNQLAQGTAQVTVAGGFDLQFTLPKTPNLGRASIAFQARGRMSSNFQHSIQIEEFRTPEFEVSAHASDAPFVVGEGGDVTVSAKYYAGGPLGGAPARWSVVAEPTTFTPPNRDDYTFGAWTPWWGGGASEGDDDATPAPATSSWSMTGTTDATGADVLHMDFQSLDPAMPMSVVASVSVTDVNRQQWSASAVSIVHPADRYVGLKTARPFVDKGTPFEVDALAVDLDGKATPGAAIEVASVRVDWAFQRGRYRRVEADRQVCAITSVADAVPCRFDTSKGGEYEVRATVVDARGRPNQTRLTYWVSGGDVVPSRDLAQQEVQLIPDKNSYGDGDTAELLVQAPFFPAEALVSWRRSGIVKTERLTLDGPTTTLHVPIVDAMVPNLVVQVDLVGAATRSDDLGQPDPKLPPRPAYAVGSIDLPIPPKQRTLAIAVAPAASKVAPGEQTQVAIDVRDARGRPVAGSEVAVIVVDEAILALTGKQFVDPVDTFYVQRGADTADYYERRFVALARPHGTGVGAVGMTGGDRDADGIPDVADKMEFAKEEAPGGPPPPPPAPMVSAAPAAAAMPVAEPARPPGQATTPIAIRSNFNPLAAFSPTVDTDARGHAVVPLKMPDNLTRYRIIAIAVAGDRQFGKGESALTARLPLMVRPSPPRFLNFGDTFRLPVVVQNQTDAALTVQVAVRASNAAITDGAGRAVVVPANDRVEVEFPAAARLAGTARFQVVAAGGGHQDASELALPVWTPATTEAFATYGVIDAGAIRQPVALPGKVWPQFGGLEVTTASTNLQALTDAMLYLVHYPYECAEQRSSRILAIAALRDVLAAFKTKDLPGPQQLEASVASDIEHLSQMQNYDGGFAFWDRGYPSEPYLSVFVASALGHARAKGFAVPKRMFDLAAPYLKEVEQHIPDWYPDDVRHAISAYALYTRRQLGDLDVAKGKSLLAQWGGPEKVTMETDGWLLGLFAGDPRADAERKAIVRHAQNHVSETAGAANFTTGYSDGNHLLLASDRRVDAVMLESLIAEQPKLDLIPKIVTGLLAHRKAGRWLNTQENSFALLALDAYFQTYEKATPNFVARVWLGDAYAGDHAFVGHTTEHAEIDVAMKDVAAHDHQDLTIQKDGAGRLYYRVGMTYAPEDLKVAPADYGFVVARRYEPIDAPGDVTRGADGVWHVKAGARVRVRVTMVNENRRYQVALVDPIPAGFEAMNPALATTGPIPQDPKQQAQRGAYWWWFGPWYEHQNLRDERVEAFAALLWEGVHDYSYVARATTPGNFVVPPPKAEEMYMPETFGRGATDRVVVE